MNDQRLKYLLNEELQKLGQPLIDCGDEWTELIERVVQKLILEREADLKAEVERLRTELVQRLGQLFDVGAEVGRLNNELAVALRNIQVMFDQQRKQESEVEWLKRENEALRDMVHEDDAVAVETLVQSVASLTRSRDEWHDKCADARSDASELRAEVERLTRENEALRDDVARAEKLLQGDSHDGCAVIEMQLKALLRECRSHSDIVPNVFSLPPGLLKRIRAALGEEGK